MNNHRLCSRFFTAVCAWVFLVSAQFLHADWRQNFDSLKNGASILDSEGWSGYRGLKGGLPATTIADGKLTISRAEGFRADNYGLFADLPESYADGVVWVQARLKQPATWIAPLFIDAYGPESGQVLARTSAVPHENAETKSKILRWRVSWVKYYWRRYIESDLQTNSWQTVTMRLDLDAKTYAAWLDDMPLGEDLPLNSGAPFTRLRISVCGSPESPAWVDDLYVGRETPDGAQAPRFFPETEDDLVFRFAAIGDPRLGHGGYETDVERFKMAVGQVNRSGAEFSLILGNKAKESKNAEAYQELAGLAEGLQAPHYYIRGNQDDLGLFQQYLHEKSEYAFVHKGVRFVMLDTLGNYEGLNDQQLEFAEEEFSAATKAGEDIILSLHVTPWQTHAKARVEENLIGLGRDRLRALMKQHHVALCLSAGFHTATWGAREEGTQYLVLPGTSVARGGTVGWSVIDVYPDRIVTHHKPLFFGYEEEGVEGYHTSENWVSYEAVRKTYPYVVQGPKTIPRRNQGQLAKAKPKKPPVDLKAASAKIDDLIAKNLKKHGIAPNALTSDDEFLRRAYLTIGGRIPTLAEGRAFHESGEKDKRGQLIDELLHSEAYVSHYYNYWADLLRINGGLGKGRPASEDAYQLWVKQALRDNMPYDEFVHSLITASEPWWENGAVGYFIRDRGMPLDAMSNTVRTFLGTRIECAQCHDHPFDKWTQMDFYKMSAFTFGIDSALPISHRENYRYFFEWTRELQAKEYDDATGNVKFPQIKSEAHLASFIKGANYPKALRRLGMNEEEFRATAQRGIKSWEAGTVRYWRYRPVLDGLYKMVLYTAAAEVKKDLKLPHDYQYSDAKPFDVIQPEPMFGPEVDMEYGDSRIGVFANWLTSEENPAFTRVIVNRLWKEAFGYGIFEPVDELMDNTQVSNPELLAYLQKLMIDLDYDMKGFLRVVFSTQSWQRAVQVEPVTPGSLYHFPGPVMRRMSAEQVWDSVVGLTIAEADQVRPRLTGQLGRLEFQRNILSHLESFSHDEFIAKMKRLAVAFEENDAKREKYREQRFAARKAGDLATYAKLGVDDYRARRMRGHILWDIGFGYEGAIEAEKARKTPTKASQSVKVEFPPEMGFRERPVPPRPPQARDQNAAEYKAEVRAPHVRYVTLSRYLARASELSSPAPRGHFLRDFGQSDREEIENAADGASIPQALNLLNGELFEGLANRFSVLGQEVHGAPTNAEKIQLIFQGMLTREPSSMESRIAAEEFERFGPQAGDGLIWALLNSQQFLFVR